ncbi:cytoplasmic protein [Bacillus toyonensis]|uniref:antitoxin YezG family protein n=1 Tax=Bacillus toyonensis TaxID=155322 RepID=UPI000BEFB4FB|nr:antitoxin YezG family protein [Bacillus toyonensis]MDF9450017.1 antitoxin YezG family protein [Bacillus toyonensis]MDG1562769.1 antitoxin YezG family protein [Bacillus toyonensis]PEO58230.1 cytoplasmic protein [Bacillus toyonensis]PFX82102.1 cytoplasmic protein [Bacillus toyonensis]PGB09765.1 cytoplasmic protein [Bacillus toyonensis]
MEKEMNRLYREIAETVNEMIPEDWNKFYFYAQISENGGGTYFFYNTLENKQYKYSVEIPFKYQIDEDEFERKEDILYKLSKELRKVFKDNQQELWYSFTMTLESSGKFKMHYDYTNWFNTEYGFSDQMIIWKNKYLGEVPNDGEYKALIDKYHSEFPNNPI